MRVLTGCWLIALLSVTCHVQPEPLQAHENHPTPATIVSLSLYQSLYLEGTPAQIERLSVWLNEIVQIPKGYQTLLAIHRSGHKLTIRHSEAARLSAGRTIAPMTERLTNGEGESVTIIFDADMDNNGTHIVYDRDNRPLEFTAVQNLYHELAHAMHMMNGQWRYFASEKQAIEDENLFREGLAHLRGIEPRLRFRSRGSIIHTVSPPIAFGQSATDPAAR